MKKLLLIGLAAAAMLTGCSNDEIVEKAQPKTIGFSSFVDNGTRSIDPSATLDALKTTGFAVYGFTQSGQLFDGTLVTWNVSKWGYTPLQYWVAGNTYTFGAVAPADVTVNGEKVDGTVLSMTIPFTSDGTTDLLHAAPAQVTADEAFVANPAQVSLTFKHQLSKVKFSFENAVGDGYNVKVKDVKITDAKQTGTLNVAAANAWSDQNGSQTLGFGNVVADNAAANADAAVIENGKALESNNEMLLIPTPASVAYTVTFTVELYHGGVLLGTYAHNVQIKNVELKLGYCYDFKATLTHENVVDPEKPLKPIEFTVDKVDNWNTAELDQTLDVPAQKG